MIIRCPNFFGRARGLRQEFEARWKSQRSDRFCWDYFFVEDQYAFWRTPAHQFFSKGLYESFHQKLVWWGRQHLGCHDISPPTLSLYLEGCGQSLHRDLPHGPLAFVYSLTRWNKSLFSGGETEILNLVKALEPKGQASTYHPSDLITRVPPYFNQLLIFNGGLPHGVREVRGVKDPLRARLVLHGWFVNPRPFVQGPLGASVVNRVVMSWLRKAKLFAGEDLHGFVSFEIGVLPDGRVSTVRVLLNTLQDSRSPLVSKPRWTRDLRNQLKRLTFPKCKRPSRLVLPIEFLPET